MAMPTLEALTNNGLMYLFSQISYSLSNQEIETLFHLGQATMVLGLLKYPNDFALAQGLNQLWTKDSNWTVGQQLLFWWTTLVLRSGKNTLFGNQQLRVHSVSPFPLNTFSDSARIMIRYEANIV